jgi:hypothetical protein
MFSPGLASIVSLFRSFSGALAAFSGADKGADGILTVDGPRTRNEAKRSGEEYRQWHKELSTTAS